MRPRSRHGEELYGGATKRSARPLSHFDMAGRHGDLGMSEFLRVAREIRARLAPLVEPPVVLLALSDGLPWEAAGVGTDLAEGEYVRTNYMRRDLNLPPITYGHIPSLPRELG